MTFDELMINGDTHNEFQYFNIQNLQNMNKCYNYYIAYAENLIKKMSPDVNMYNKKQSKSFEILYTWDIDVNAGSIENVLEDYLQLNEGSILNIYSFFYKFNTRMPPIIIGSDLGLCKELNINLHYTNAESKVINLEMPISDNAIRNNLAEYMAMLAIKFLIAHEIGHLYNGHSQFYLETIDLIKKSKSDSEKQELYLDLQTLEMDADAFGINRVVDEAINLIETSDKILNLLKDKNDIFKILHYSIHGLFYLLRNKYGYDDMIHYTFKKHPPKFVREAMLYDAAMEHIRFISSVRKCNFEYDFVKKDADIETVMNKLYSVSGNDYKKYIGKYSESMAVLGKKIQDNWKNKLSYILKSEARLPIEGIDY